MVESFLVKDSSKFKAAVLQFLTDYYPETARTFASESSTSASDNAKVGTVKLLEKKWLATTHLQIKIKDLETNLRKQEVALQVIQSVYKHDVRYRHSTPMGVLNKCSDARCRSMNMICSPQQLPFVVLADFSKPFLHIMDYSEENMLCTRASISTKHLVTCIAISRSGQHIVIALDNGDLELVDLACSPPSVNVIGNNDLEGVAQIYLYQTNQDEITQTASAEFLACTVSTRGVFRVWDIYESRCLRTIAAPANKVVKSHCLFVGGGGLPCLLVGTADGEIFKWPISVDAAAPDGLVAHSRAVEALTCSSELKTDKDKAFYVSGGRDWLVKIWQGNSNRVLHTLKGHTDWVTAVALNAEGSVLVSTGDDRKILVWDVVGGKLLRTIEDAHAQLVRQICFDPSGHRLYTCEQRIDNVFVMMGWLSVPVGLTMEVWDCEPLALGDDSLPAKPSEKGGLELVTVTEASTQPQSEMGVWPEFPTKEQEKTAAVPVKSWEVAPARRVLEKLNARKSFTTTKDDLLTTKCSTTQQTKYSTSPRTTGTKPLRTHRIESHDIGHSHSPRIPVPAIPSEISVIRCPRAKSLSSKASPSVDTPGTISSSSPFLATERSNGSFLSVGGGSPPGDLEVTPNIEEMSCSPPTEASPECPVKASAAESNLGDSHSQTTERAPELSKADSLAAIVGAGFDAGAAASLKQAPSSSARVIPSAPNATATSTSKFSITRPSTTTKVIAMAAAAKPSATSPTTASTAAPAAPRIAQAPALGGPNFNAPLKHQARRTTTSSRAATAVLAPKRSSRPKTSVETVAAADTTPSGRGGRSRTAKGV